MSHAIQRQEVLDQQSSTLPAQSFQHADINAITAQSDPDVQNVVSKERSESQPPIEVIKPTISVRPIPAKRPADNLTGSIIKGPPLVDNSVVNVNHNRAQTALGGSRGGYNPRIGTAVGGARVRETKDRPRNDKQYKPIPLPPNWKENFDQHHST